MESKLLSEQIRLQPPQDTSIKSVKSTWVMTGPKTPTGLANLHNRIGCLHPAIFKSGSSSRRNKVVPVAQPRGSIASFRNRSSGCLGFDVTSSGPSRYRNLISMAPDGKAMNQIRLSNPSESLSDGMTL